MKSHISDLDYIAETLIDLFIDDEQIHDMGCRDAKRRMGVDEDAEMTEAQIEDFCVNYHQFQIKCLEHAIARLRAMSSPS